MTIVTFKMFRNSIYGIKLEGHACFNLKGPDILCASLSIASQMICNQLCLEANVLSTDVTYETSDGYLNFELKSPILGKSPRVSPLFDSFYNAVLSLKTNDEFINYIDIKKEDWHEN